MGIVVPDWLGRQASLTPDRVAIDAPEGTVTFRAFEALVARAAGRLRGVDVRDGERVAVLARNSLPYAALIHAVPRAGGILVPLNTRLSRDELRAQIADAGVRLLVADAAHRGVAGMLGVPVLGTDDLEGTLLPAPERVNLDRPHSIIYTSGTTGAPKGAIVTHGNLWHGALASAVNMGHEPGDRWLCVLPLFHVGGLSIVTRGAILGIAAVIHERFDVGRVNAAIERGDVTIVSAVSVMLAQLSEGRDRPFPSSLRAVLLGGGPASRDLLERAASLHIPVLQTYGLTETASQAATLAPGDALRKLGSAGKPLSVTEIRIDADEPGVSGEILVRGLTVTPGYYGRPEATAEALRDGWLHTGDLGYLDEEGYLYVLDRRDDLIVSGGENIYPAEVERVLSGHPAVADVCVVGIPDTRWGQRPVAAVVLRGSATSADLLTFCRERLAGYKVPDRFVIRDELPRNAGGKVLRRVVRETLDEPPSAGL
ncbi:MAG TPA: o-succinylbenzoate--CoA ligase [Chloroflexota bacterium]|nr:o-succinylbenzoate--CoA ligase [Chloroflexota bacterium]